MTVSSGLARRSEYRLGSRVGTGALLAIFVVACSPDHGGGGDEDARGGRDTATDVTTPGDGPEVDDQPDTATDDIADTRPDARVRRTLDDSEPCDSEAPCIGRTCMTGPAWTDGYCTVSPCESDRDCSSTAAVCTEYDGVPMCALRCENDDDCREGYACERAPGRVPLVCLPGVRRTGLMDGEACAADAECRGGTCLPDPYYPGGYCTTLACEDNLSCSRGPYDNLCMQFPTQSMCVRRCIMASDCRAPGYACTNVAGRLNICSPDVTPPVRGGLDPATYPLPLNCGLTSASGEVRIEYDVADTTVSYMVTPFTLDGASLQPQRIELPSGGVIDMRGDNEFQTAPSLIFGFINPIVVPGTPAFQGQLEAGRHTLVVSTRTDNLCWYLLERASTGETLDLNLYFTGLDGLSAGTAASDPTVATLVALSSGILEGAGITLGTVRYFDGDDTYAFIRSDYDAQELVESSAPPSDDVSSLFSLNVFLTRGFDGSILGLSLGLPGAAALHGSRSSGVVVSAEYLRDTDGAAFTAQVLAHEVGHFLGLFHTTEQGARGFDPLTDTPQCEPWNVRACPDRTNLMFPFAGADQTIISEQQAGQLRANPLVR